MTLRRLLILLSTITLLAVALIGSIHFRTCYLASIDENEARAIRDALTIEESLSGNIGHLNRVVKIFAGLGVIHDVFSDSGELSTANSVLDKFTEMFDLSVCYLMDTSGLVIASSNRGSASSFVGNNYSFRPYFKNAMAGSIDMYLGVGVTSGQRGIYYSAPVTDPGDGRILGVAVMKSDAAPIETYLREASQEVSGISLLSSPQGIIFMGSRDDWLYHSLRPLDPARIDVIRNDRQMGDGPWPWTGLAINDTSSAEGKNGTRYLMYRKNLETPAGWSFIHLKDREILKSVVIDGELRNTVLITFFVLGLLGIIVVLLIFKTDIEITERSRVEARLITSEARYRELFDHTVNGIVIYEAENDGADFIIKELNAATEAILCTERDAIIGSNVTDTFPGVRESGLIDAFRRVHRTGIPERYPVSFSKDGKTERWMENFVFNLPTGELAAFFVDLTEHKNIEESLRRSEQRFKSVFEEIADAIVVVDSAGTILFVNGMAASFFNRDREELLGTTFEIPLEEQDHVPVPLEGPDGNGIVAEMKLVETEWEGQRVFLASLRDITERKRAEKDRLELEERLSQIQKMEAIGTLAGGIAHDFNNILSSVLGFTELAMDEAQPGSNLESNLSEVMDAGKRAKGLVSQIVMFSRQSDQENQPFQLQPLIKETVKLLKSSLPPTIEITHDIRSDAVILADPVNMHQLLLNLCTNASQAMSESGGQLTITTSNLIVSDDLSPPPQKLSAGHYLQLTVSDTGPGIDDAILDRIFDPFFTTKGTGEGTGMGLSVVHGIVEAHRGCISVDTQKGFGTSFHICFPVVQSDLEKRIHNDPTGADMPETILFVDDEASIGKMVKQSLGKSGYTVVPLTSSTEALSIFKNEPTRFDLVITDMTMPAMNGLELAEKLKHIKLDIPIILCTGYNPDMEEIKEAAPLLDAVVDKPLVKNQLLETIREVSARCRQVETLN